jgi:predicted ArsR family transcriptional regulator
MSEVELDEALLRFLLRVVESYDDIDALLLLAKESTKRFTAEDLAARLHLPIEEARTVLQRLASRGAVQLAGTDPAPAYMFERTHAEVVELLARTFASDRLLVVRWMNARAIARVRDEAHKTFADAFLFRRKDPDG